MKSEYKRKIFGYECDIYGHLNNANYLHVFEEARSKAIADLGVSVSELFEMNVHIYITDVRIQFLRGVPLEDTITVLTSPVKANRLKSTWHQEIYDQAGNLCSIGEIVAVFARDGKPYRISQDLMERLGIEG